MFFCDGLDDCQTEARTLNFLLFVRHAVETLEQAGLRFKRDARPIVLDANPYGAPARASRASSLKNCLAVTSPNMRLPFAGCRPVLQAAFPAELPRLKCASA